MQVFTIPPTIIHIYNSQFMIIFTWLPALFSHNVANIDVKYNQLSSRILRGFLDYCHFLLPYLKIQLHVVYKPI